MVALKHIQSDVQNVVTVIICQFQIRIVQQCLEHGFEILDTFRQANVEISFLRIELFLSYT